MRRSATPTGTACVTCLQLPQSRHARETGRGRVKGLRDIEDPDATVGVGLIVFGRFPSPRPHLWGQWTPRLERQLQTRLFRLITSPLSLFALPNLFDDERRKQPTPPNEEVPNKENVATRIESVQRARPLCAALDGGLSCPARETDPPPHFL